MSLYLEEEEGIDLPFDIEETAALIVETAIHTEQCPFETEVNILLTGNEEIHELNRIHRGIDRPTDVLSFPALEFLIPGDFTPFEEDGTVFHPETGELMLGDIVISKDKVITQAEEYGHTPRREFAFLIAHSMLHLFGYDHIEEDERKTMEEHQRRIMEKAGIPR